MRTASTLLRPALACSLRAPAPSASLVALPSIGAQAIWPTAAASGVVAVAAQLTLLTVFKRSKDKAVSSTPGILAYRIVALFFTLALTVIGGALFLNPGRWPAGAAVAMLAPEGTVRFLGALLFGELVMWDLPCAVWIPTLRRPDYLLHHIGLAIGPALVAMRFMPLFYYAWYIGLSEASSVFLALNEIFANLHDNVERTGQDERRVARLAGWRDSFQIGAAASFVAVRVAGWAWVCWLLLRDTLAVLPLAASHGVRGFLRLQLGMALAFYALQLFWFAKLVAYTLSSGLGGRIPDE